MDRISPDSFLRIFSYLFASEITKTCLVSKYLYGLTQTSEFWKQVSHHDGSGLVHDILTSVRNNQKTQADSGIMIPEENGTYNIVARSIEALSSLKIFRTHQLHQTSDDIVPRMEGHACCLLLGRFIVIVGGWGPEGTNEIYTFDGACLPELKAIKTRTVNIPDFVYGFSAIAAQSYPQQIGISSPESLLRVVVFGGCTSGGYSGDVNGAKSSADRYPLLALQQFDYSHFTSRFDLLENYP